MGSLTIFVNILEEFLRIYRMKINLQKIHQAGLKTNGSQLATD